MIEPCLIDTVIFVHLVRNDVLVARLLERYLDSDPAAAYCSVCEGEVRSLSYQLKWGTQKIERVTHYLKYFRAIPIETPTIMETYAMIDTYSRQVGISMGKNDIWIAATSHVTEYPLLTADKDFDHLHGKFIQVIRINSKYRPNTQS